MQAENIQQAETLVKLTEKLESLSSDVQDTQQLIGALHSEFQITQPSAMELANIVPSPGKLEESAYVSCPHCQREHRAPSAVLMSSILCRCNGEAAATGHEGTHHLPGCQGPGPQRLLCSCHRQWCSCQQWSSTLRGGDVQPCEEASCCLITFTRGLAGAAHLHAKAPCFEEWLGMCMDLMAVWPGNWKACVLPHV